MTLQNKSYIPQTYKSMRVRNLCELSSIMQGHLSGWIHTKSIFISVSHHLHHSPFLCFPNTIPLAELQEKVNSDFRGSSYLFFTQLRTNRLQPNNRLRVQYSPLFIANVHIIILLYNKLYWNRYFYFFCCYV